MAKHNIYNLLIDPVTGAKLFPDGKILKSDGSESTYPIVEGVPYILPAGNITNEYGMDYSAHYETDSSVSDYFAVQECGATADDFRRIRQLIKSRVPKSSELILDVGSGSAWVAKMFCEEGKSVCSFDISLRNATRAIKLYPHENHTAISGDALRPPFCDDSFDCVISSEVIEHTVDPALFIASLFRLVKPGGRLIITTPYKEIIHYEVCIHCNQPTPRNAHLHSFDETILMQMALLPGAENSMTVKFGNKALIFARTYMITRSFPFLVWKIIDKLFNLLINKPAHIALIIDKKTS